MGGMHARTPEHLLYLKEIKRALPNAKIVHIIRDGRDVALSEVRQNWIRPLPWDRSHALAVSGLYWEWIVRKGREDGKKIAPDYMEVRFEELVDNPRAVLSLKYQGSSANLSTVKLCSTMQ